MKRSSLSLHQNTEHGGISSHSGVQIWASTWLLKGEGLLTDCVITAFLSALRYLLIAQGEKHTSHTHTQPHLSWGFPLPVCFNMPASKQWLVINGVLKLPTGTNQRNHLLLLLSLIHLSIYIWVDVTWASLLCTQLNNPDDKMSWWKWSSSYAACLHAASISRNSQVYRQNIHRLLDTQS